MNWRIKTLFRKSGWNARICHPTFRPGMAAAPYRMGAPSDDPWTPAPPAMHQQQQQQHFDSSLRAQPQVFALTAGGPMPFPLENPFAPPFVIPPKPRSSRYKVRLPGLRDLVLLTPAQTELCRAFIEKVCNALAH